MTQFTRTTALRALAAGAALLALAACSSKPDRVENAAVCPEIRVPDEAGEITRFRPGGAIDLTDVAFQARITGTGLECHGDEGGDAMIDLAVGFEGARGPAASQAAFPITYFVAVVGPDGAILNRESFGIELQLPDRRSLDTRTDEIRVTIPVREGTTVADYRLFAGIQLTAEEFKYNREYR